MFKEIMLTTLALFFLVPNIIFAGFNEGVTAYRAGDLKGAFKVFEVLAEKGNIKAQYQVGWMYENGKEVPKNYQQAAVWYKKAAILGSGDAQYNLGVMYQLGKGFLQDYQEAVKWFRKAAKQGDMMAQHNLGISYFYGNGVPQDYIEAYEWANIAASKGDWKAVSLRNTLVKKMTPLQLEKAQVRSQVYLKKYVEGKK